MAEPESIRVFYRGVHGRARRNFNWARITKNSAVLVTAAECSFNPGNHVQGGIPVPGQPLPFNEVEGWKKERPNLGDADVYVTNIGAHGDGGEAGGVEFILHVNWDSPLPVVVTITWLGECEDFIVA
jgi:hypothetical protein